MLIRRGFVALLLCVSSGSFGQSMPAVNAVPSNCTGGNPLAYNGSAWACGAPQSPSTTVGSLPTCNTAARGLSYIVTDSLLPASLATVSAGGAVVVRVTCDGSAWKVM